mmetsp:Transcript_19024/g.48703  ORF Transcript_19024/g.48703 Transcript_19024/m.48703 type:complete len:93 (-) Transcript_19024:247-525(-)
MLQGEFGNKLSINSSVYLGTDVGAFEVTVGGKLIHSALKLGHGKVECDEELDAILLYIEQELNKRRSVNVGPAAEVPREQADDGGASKATPP